MSENESSEAFLQGNANPKHIVEVLAEVLRDLMRATAAKEDPFSAVTRATENWKHLLELLKRCEEPLSWRRLFDDAVEMLRPEDLGGDGVDRAIQEIARAGMSYYVERRGQPVGKKRSQLEEAIAHLELRRKMLAEARRKADLKSPSRE
jgi:hypothetical protein